MTKLLEWLTGAVLFAGVWAYLFNSTPENSTDYARHFVLFLPIYTLLAFAVSNFPFLFYFFSSISKYIILFQVVSVSIIAWRVYTFNDCEEAAKELQQEIKEAKADLRKRGLKID